MKMYETKDFYLACLILSNEYKLINSRREGGSVWFEFASDDKLQGIVDEFINFNATANVRLFTRSMARLRRELDKHRV